MLGDGSIGREAQRPAPDLFAFQGAMVALLAVDTGSRTLWAAPRA